jgi:hypothetical protein
MPVQQLNAQDKSKSEQEKNIRIQMEIDQQKKAMSEQKKAIRDMNKVQEEISEDFIDQQEDIEDNLRDIEIEAGEAVEAEAVATPRFPRSRVRSFHFNEPLMFTPGAEPFYGISFGGDNERTTWDFSKTVKENTFTRDYSFDVEKSVNSVVMSVNGDCKAGEIRIKIVMPNGKNYSDIVIDEFGNLNWRKSFTISDTENLDKTGEWKFKIESTKATGYFKISLQTY